MSESSAVEGSPVKNSYVKQRSKHVSITSVYQLDLSNIFGDLEADPARLRSRPVEHLRPIGAHRELRNLGEANLNALLCGRSLRIRFQASETVLRQPCNHGDLRSKALPVLAINHISQAVSRRSSVGAWTLREQKEVSPTKLALTKVIRTKPQRRRCLWVLQGLVHRIASSHLSVTNQKGVRQVGILGHEKLNHKVQ